MATKDLEQQARDLLETLKWPDNDSYAVFATDGHPSGFANFPTYRESTMRAFVTEAIIAALTSAQGNAGHDDQESPEYKYLQGGCTDSDCPLCSTESYARKPGMKHAGLSPYKQGNAEGEGEAVYKCDDGGNCGDGGYCRKCPHKAVEVALEIGWRAGVTCSANECTRRSDDYNSNDDDTRLISEAADCGKAVARWLDPAVTDW